MFWRSCCKKTSSVSTTAYIILILMFQTFKVFMKTVYIFMMFYWILYCYTYKCKIISYLKQLA